MDIQQLKLIAGLVRDLLQQNNHTVNHSQSLDLVAALPGLRNWPEIQAFPDRVAACEVDLTSASRLAFRLNKKFELDLTPQAMLLAFSSPDVEKITRAPQLWPTGPTPGVYLTISQDAINALLERYEDATDGAMVYAEQAGAHWDGSIDLGEYGLWSNGLSRVSSGTLIVVGPVELDQQSWGNSASRLVMACLDALNSDHRVAVLVNTPTPDTLCEDILLMVRSSQEDGDDIDTALLGVVTEEGELQRREPFANSRPRPASIQSVATVDAIPSSVRSPLKKAIGKRSSGLLLLGSSIIKDNWADDLVAASLALTEHAGPAARIMPRHRSTPAKDWLVPEAIKQLPFLPSIESAYDQGYRRMIINSGYSDSELLLKFGKEVLFISGNYGSDVSDVFMNALRAGSLKDEEALLALVIAVLGVKSVSGKHGIAVASDLYVMQPESALIRPKEFKEVIDFPRENRLVKWEDEMTSLLDSGIVTVANIKKELSHDRSIGEFLSQRTAAKKMAMASH